MSQSGQLELDNISIINSLSTWIILNDKQNYLSTPKNYSYCSIIANINDEIKHFVIEWSEEGMSLISISSILGVSAELLK